MRKCKERKVTVHVTEQEIRYKVFILVNKQVMYLILWNEGKKEHRFNQEAKEPRRLACRRSCRSNHHGTGETNQKMTETI